MRFTAYSTAYVAAAVLSLAHHGSASSTKRVECLSSRSAELARLSACGHEGSIQYCLSVRLLQQQQGTEALLLQPSAVAQCYVDAGCTAEEAAIEAEWTLKRCDTALEAGGLGELRRRMPKDEAETTTTAKTTADAVAKTTTAATTATTATTDAPETSVVVVTEFLPTSTLVCYTTTTTSTTICPIQSTGPKSGKETLSCYPTVVSYPTCAAGLLCRNDQSGQPICLKLNNKLGIAGIIISLGFAAGMAIAIFAMCFFCCRERRQQTRIAKAAEAAAIARQAALDKKRPGAAVRNADAHSDTQPLMHQQDPPPPMPGMRLQGHVSAEAAGDVVGHNPFLDQHQLR